MEHICHHTCTFLRTQFAMSSLIIDKVDKITDNVWGCWLKKIEFSSSNARVHLWESCWTGMLLLIALYFAIYTFMIVGTIPVPLQATMASSAFPPVCISLSPDMLDTLEYSFSLLITNLPTSIRERFPTNIFQYFELWWFVNCNFSWIQRNFLVSAHGNWRANKPSSIRYWNKNLLK